MTLLMLFVKLLIRILIKRKIILKIKIIKLIVMKSNKSQNKLSKRKILHNNQKKRRRKRHTQENPRLILMRKPKLYNMNKKIK
jgi:hypothetical protein